MASAFSQIDRIGRLKTALADDELVLMRLDADEAMNSLFEFRVEALSEKGDIDPDQLLGTHATIAIDQLDGTERHFDGIVTQSRWVGIQDTAWAYNFVLRPWFWLCGRRRNQRIFHEMSVDEIIQQLLSDYSDLGAPHLQLDLAGTYPKLEYTVQYRESDLAFACRLMERFGINYHFVHNEGSHTMVLTDRVDSLPEISGSKRVFKPVGHEHRFEEEQIWEWQPERRVTIGKIAMTDYNFKTPLAAMMADQTGDAQHAHGTIESYDYPGVYLEQGEGRGVASLRTEQERSGDVRHFAKGNTLSLHSGMRVTLDGELPGIAGKEYVARQIFTSFRSQAYVAGGSAGAEKHAYTQDIVFVEADGPVVPERKTPLPLHYGPQTATVVGDGEIDCDEFGRILVKFHWDREDAYSMRCRVSQLWANGTWGGMAIPRIGMEVLVEFLEGDPDKPLVTGCVYNGKNDPPYPLPEHKTKMVIRSDTHQGEGYNEITFEDQAGQEDIFIHAQKDNTVKILNDQSVNIGNNRVEHIANNHSLQVGANVMERVHANKTTTIGGGGAAMLKSLQPLIAAGGKFLTSGAQKTDSGSGVAGFAGIIAGVTDIPNEIQAITSKLTFRSSGQHRQGAGADQSAKSSAMAGLLSSIMPASGTQTTTIEKYKKETVGAASTEQVGLAKNVLVGAGYTTSVGNLMKTMVGKDYTLEARETIYALTTKHTLQAKEKFIIGGPGGTIIIDSSGVTIKTKHLKVKAPKVDFTSGSPDQVDALSSDKPFAQDCKGK